MVGLPLMGECIDAGLKRFSESRRLGMRRPDHEIEPPNILQDIEGAIGEGVVAIALGYKDWKPTVNNTTGADVGPYHVRHVPRDSLRLIVRPRDIEHHGDDAIFILVSGAEGHYRIRGWLTAKEARQLGSFENPKNKGRGLAWFVRASDLHPLDTLPRP